LVAAVVAVALALLSIFIVRRRLGAARDAAAVAEALREMDALRARRDEISRQLGEKDDAIQAIDARILEQKRKIVHLHEGGEQISDEDLDKAFAELGY